MKRKVFISTLVLFFFVSTTGLPVTLHLCTMNESGNDSDMDMCEMHSHSNKCEGAQHSNYSKVQIEKKDCCETEYKYEAISDQFLQINLQKDFHSPNFIAIIDFDLLNIHISIPNADQYFTDTSPPTLISNQIYLNNSILLI